MTPILSVTGLEKTFGSVVAAHSISVEVPPGQTVGIIGANGAGKTTFVNMITGHLAPSQGSITFDGREITGLPSRTITRLGIARSFQVAQIFPSLTVLANMCTAAAIAGHGKSVLRAATVPLFARANLRQAERTLEQFRISQFRNARAGTVPQGVRKLLDIAMAAAGEPRLLLLDEPTSGVSREEKHGVMEVVTSALKGRGTTVLFVEHDMEIVEGYADRVLAFHDGTIIADGPPARTLADPQVREFITGAPIAVSRRAEARHA
jgi:branched-chain amino acid transport system ATP-binding protein